MPDCTYMKIFLNEINEFKTYTVNSLKREGERGGGEEKKEKGREEEEKEKVEEKKKKKK
jgi:hypothetical protein